MDSSKSVENISEWHLNWLYNTNERHSFGCLFRLVAKLRFAPYDLRSRRRRREWESEVKTTKCCFDRSDIRRVRAKQAERTEAKLCDTRTDGAMKNPFSASFLSFKLNTFQHYVLKYAKLKGTTRSYTCRLPHYVWKTAFFHYCQRLKKNSRA